MSVILDSAEAIGGKKCIASMRLVSKSWLAAVRAHPIKPKHMTLTANQDLVKLCAIMPHIVSLEFDCSGKGLDLSPVSAQSSLTHLSISGHTYPQRHTSTPLITGAILSHLPNSLCSLVLQGICVQPENLGSSRFARLRELTFDILSAFPAFQELVKCLPNLEVNGYWLVTFNKA